MQQVDDFLEPLTEDYIALYKENSVLKSKMKVLVNKLEEYRAQEADLRSRVANAQTTCDQMIAETQKKCAAMTALIKAIEGEDYSATKGKCEFLDGIVLSCRDKDAVNAWAAAPSA